MIPFTKTWLVLFSKMSFVRKEGKERKAHEDLREPPLTEPRIAAACSRHFRSTATYRGRGAAYPHFPTLSPQDRPFPSLSRPLDPGHHSAHFLPLVSPLLVLTLSRTGPRSSHSTWLPDRPVHGHGCSQIWALSTCGVSLQLRCPMAWRSSGRLTCGLLGAGLTSTAQTCSCLCSYPGNGAHKRPGARARNTPTT